MYFKFYFGWKQKKLSIRGLISSPIWPQTTTVKWIDRQLWNLPVHIILIVGDTVSPPLTGQKSPDLSWHARGNKGRFKFLRIPLTPLQTPSTAPWAQSWCMRGMWSDHRQQLRSILTYYLLSLELSLVWERSSDTNFVKLKHVDW